MNTIDLIDRSLGNFKEMGGSGSGHKGHKGVKGQKGGSARSKPLLGSKLPYQPSAEIISSAEAVAHKELEWATINWGEGNIGPEGVEIVAAKVETQLEEDLSQPISIRRGIRGAMGVVEDGRFKTQFETGTSGGQFAPDVRLNVERKGLGVPKDRDQHPVYGYFPTSRHVAYVYGSVEFVLKDSVKERATYTIGDSLHNFSIGQQVGGTKPSDRGAWDSGALRDYLGGTLTYIEAQIQGGVPLGDVSKVIIHSSPGSHPDLHEKLLKKGVKVEFDESTS